MPQFGRKGDLLTVSYITGPRHVWLGLRLSRTPADAPEIVKHPPLGECAHGGLDEAELVAAVVARLQDHGLYAERLEYVENDSPAYNLYAHCAGLLAKRFITGKPESEA